ncbi:MAG: exodeoxyribonuclease VII large subunit [Planctomycetales bacterium]
MPTDSTDDVEILSVAQLTSQIKETLEGRFPSVWVSGEISNFARPQSGHCYLTLKDSTASLRAVIWRSVANRIPFDLHDGLEVTAFGSIDVYAPRGSYQLSIQNLEPQGIGALELALRQLRSKLAAEGLFDPERKRPLPSVPRRVAFVTSPTGAAIRDFLEVLRRRFPGTKVLIIPVRVQGEGAGREIAEGIERANEFADDLSIDVVVIGRGGGSLEDLWAFNEEVVARAIAASELPVVSAVGHEIDVTISDLVADRRALTPSEAAELIAPSRDEIAAALSRQRERLAFALRTRLMTAQSRLETVASARSFRRPLDSFHDAARRLDELSARGVRAMNRRLEQSRASMVALASGLNSLSPLAILGRGYSLTRGESDGRALRRANEIAVGDRIVTRLADGTLISRVEETRPADES